ncbi:amino acid ABC transporter permease [Niveispirillum cyanobacteriorum]|uniref:Amino acid ABC transporter permease n=1 Tax=Niveispirillum cyanobacteriorum TaxID=1612173 RepID=A0A2K9NBA0_9PROT|nr:amino acid ABC transporter permease [Niveispirillum cyanobacteriorum]AUN30394.1 amino acid ABC transporter permease [Niveispirillum cyanobacteriorum]GGE54999.1 ABC transporter permease [Niveispirillum cyanobacteriorum]
MSDSNATATKAAAPPGRAAFHLSINNPIVRAVLAQLGVALAVALVAWYLVGNTMDNLARLSIASGFGFLDREAGFQIGETLVEFGPQDHYSTAFLVGILNTLKVSGIGILLATLLGVVLGIARLSSNWLVARIAAFYVETVRNVPLLLQLFLWYGLLTEGLPGPRQALAPLPGVFLSNRGLKLPAPADDPIWAWVAALFGLGIILTLVIAAWNAKRQAATGKRLSMLPIGLGLVFGLPLLVLLASGGGAIDMPVLQGFNFRGGMTLSPEFAALLFGLVIYTAAFIGEIVRSGILAVPKGQTEAATALGLTRGQLLRLVVLPQALRVIIPPTTSQYLNLTKNSSLAVAIGYPDFVSIANTTINQTGQAVEGVLSIMAAYLIISLSLSFLMNWYNSRVALVER